MALFKIEDRYPDYRERFAEDSSIMDAGVYAQTGNDSDKVGSVYTILVDESDRFRYLVVDTGFWIFGKKVLLPMGRCIDDPKRNRIYVTDLTKAQVEALPDYRNDLIVDDSYEDLVRSVYLMSSASALAPVELSTSAEPATVEASSESAPATSGTGDRAPDLYTMNGANHRRLRLYEERLVTDKHRAKTGEITVTKRIETEQVEASVPIQKEKIIIEIESVVGTTTVNTPADSVQDGDVTQIDVYGEQATIGKEPVVRQEINIRKEVDEDTVIARAELRREELDVRTEGSPEVIDRTL
ncbi:MAG: DUF2382 domain-containing protein [Cyanobacteria bacterium J06638_28]